MKTLSQYGMITLGKTITNGQSTEVIDLSGLRIGELSIVSNGTPTGSVYLQRSFNGVDWFYTENGQIDLLGTEEADGLSRTLIIDTPMYLVRVLNSAVGGSIDIHLSYTK